jgi:phosphohistidine phosphatase
MSLPYILYLVRHGIAVDASAKVSDAERGLTADGARKMTRIARGLKRLGVSPDVILSSPLRRAEETAMLIAEELTPERPIEMQPLLAPGSQPADLLKSLRTQRRAHHIFLVGHQPDLGELASYLLTRSPRLAPLPFRKGGIAALSVTGLPPRAPAALQWFMTPSQLRAIGRGRRA